MFQAEGIACTRQIACCFEFVFIPPAREAREEFSAVRARA